MRIGSNEAIERSTISTSSVKTRPAIGALKIPAMAALAPHPTSSIIVFLSMRNICPGLLPMAEPVSTIGASAPTDPPNPMVIPEATTDDQQLCPLQFRLLGRNRIEHSRDTMRDIVSHHILDKERGKIDAHDREQEEKQIVGAFLKTRSEQYLYLVHDTMQEKSGNGGKQTDDKSQDKRHRRSEICSFCHATILAIVPGFSAISSIISYYFFKKLSFYIIRIPK